MATVAIERLRTSVSIRTTNGTTEPSVVVVMATSEGMAVGSARSTSPPPAFTYIHRCWRLAEQSSPGDPSPACSVVHTNGLW